MRMTMLGTFEDVAGFALAGVQGTVCDTASAVCEALAAARRDPAVAVIIVSEALERVAPDAIHTACESSGLPVVVVLPADDGGVP